MVITAQDTKLKPGYKQTEVGVIPEDWKVTKLGEVADVKTGPFGSALHEKDYVDDGTPIITVEHLGEQGVVYVNLPMVSDLDRKRLKAYSLLKGDIVFSRVGSVDRNSLIKEEESGWLFSGRLLRIRVKTSDIYSSFLSYYFNQEHTKQRIRAVAVGQTMASLNTQILRNIDIAFPPTKSEQKAIATTLSDVDALITSLDRLIAKKRDIKQATMRQLLTGKTRLPGFSDEWKVKKLGEIFQFLSTANNSRSDLSENGEIKYIHYGDIHMKWRSFLDCSGDELPLIQKDKVRNVPFLEDGDLVMADASEDYEGIGVSVEVKNATGKKVVAGLHTFLLRGDKEVLADGFKGYLQYIPAVKESLKKAATGISVYGISKNNVRNISICLPDTTEQCAIAAILSDMDAEIAALAQKCDKMRALKLGMMQELLSGKTRLI